MNQIIQVHKLSEHALNTLYKGICDVEKTQELGEMCKALKHDLEVEMQRRDEGDGILQKVLDDIKAVSDFYHDKFPAADGSI